MSTTPHPAASPSPDSPPTHQAVDGHGRPQQMNADLQASARQMTETSHSVTGNQDETNTVVQPVELGQPSMPVTVSSGAPPPSQLPRAPRQVFGNLALGGGLPNVQGGAQQPLQYPNALPWINAAPPGANVPLTTQQYEAALAFMTTLQQMQQGPYGAPPGPLGSLIEQPAMSSVLGRHPLLSNSGFPMSSGPMSSNTTALHTGDPLQFPGHSADFSGFASMNGPTVAGPHQLHEGAGPSESSSSIDSEGFQVTEARGTAFSAPAESSQSSSLQPEVTISVDFNEDGDENDADLEAFNPAQRQVIRRIVQRMVDVAYRKLISRLEILIKAKDHRSSQKRKVPTAIQNAVHQDMRRLLGVPAGTVTGRRQGDFQVPAPLAMGSDTRTAPNGDTIWNPDWTLKVNEGVNAAYVQAAAALVKQNGVQGHKLPADLADDLGTIQHSARTYWRTLKKKYLSQTDEVWAQKAEQKRINDKLYGRRHRRADGLRQGIPVFRQIFGKENTVGVEEVVQSPWQSDEAESDGEADHAEWEQCRKAFGASTNAYEVRGHAWKGRKLSTLYVTLAVCARFDKERRDARTLLRSQGRAELDGYHADDEAAGEQDADTYPELSDTERIALRSQLEASVANWYSIYLNPAQQTDRFRGPAANRREFPRKDSSTGRRTLYKECFSRKWAAENAEHSRWYESAPSCPPEFTTFKLDIPQTLIPRGD
ncbi:hypothetical protein BV20DRAFT_1058163 [Pilatotrama ljubarskyi]|nr:hypothetical protein BV20DRAFT_1058163 [Pilatotrama ljubarskyi]